MLQPRASVRRTAYVVALGVSVVALSLTSHPAAVGAIVGAGPALLLGTAAFFVVNALAAFNTRVAERDALTALPNLSALRSRIARGEDPVTVLVIALDDLGTIRETLGHATADLLLTQVAGRLRDVLPERDVLARVGGDGELALVPEG